MTTPLAQLAARAGAWSGTNDFRLMPSDPPHTAATTAAISAEVAGTMATLAYTWTHPDDGEQTGLLVLGQGEADDEVSALWADTWHQPAAKSLNGKVADGVVTVEYAYGDGEWRWQIIVDARDAGLLSVRMVNVVPVSSVSQDVPAGAYAAMEADFRPRP